MVAMLYRVECLCFNQISWSVCVVIDCDFWVPAPLLCIKFTFYYYYYDLFILLLSFSSSCPPFLVLPFFSSLLIFPFFFLFCLLSPHRASSLRHTGRLMCRCFLTAALQCLHLLSSGTEEECLTWRLAPCSSTSSQVYVAMRITRENSEMASNTDCYGFACLFEFSVI